jgi:DNA-binding NarL/FixJ family response regulator
MIPTASQNAARHQVLLVDDHALVREWLATLINQQPDLAVCGEATNTPDALNRVALAHPDIAVVDISLAGSSGLELTRLLKTRAPETAVLILSMHEEWLFAERAFRAGARGYVMKRESASKVIEAIRQILSGATYISDETGRVLATRATGSGVALSDLIGTLSDREMEVFELLGTGNNPVQIASLLGIDLKTVHTYCARLREKLSAPNTTELLRQAFHWCQAVGKSPGSR